MYQLLEGFLFSQARANRKEQKDVWRSLGNGVDLAAASLRHYKFTTKNMSDSSLNLSNNAKISVLELGGSDEKAVGETDNSMPMSQGRVNRKQQKTIVSGSLGNELEFEVAASEPHQLSLRQDDDDDPIASKRGTPVPKFGVWDRKAPGSINYTMEFSQARATRKQQKADVRLSLGNDWDFMAASLHPLQPPRQDDNQDTTVAKNAWEIVSDFGGWDRIDPEFVAALLPHQPLPCQPPCRQDKDDHVSVRFLLSINFATTTML
ncbi:dihydropyrimidinase-like [Hibiscus syriacus]|uniref:Dihydropyrimidinase-like n=1 Tax=Hibiscus syriacus TaxID=106335 RepID=A0A6A2XZI9_HIBSY|nr:dihydropyrimidinase-like [Hibiscus syriacus]